MTDPTPPATEDQLWGLFFYVERDGKFDVIWPGAKRAGRSEHERSHNYFPRIVCTCADREDAEQIAEVLHERFTQENEHPSNDPIK